MERGYGPVVLADGKGHGVLTERLKRDLPVRSAALHPADRVLAPAALGGRVPAEPRPVEAPARHERDTGGLKRRHSHFQVPKVIEGSGRHEALVLLLLRRAGLVQKIESPGLAQSTKIHEQQNCILGGQTGQQAIGRVKAARTDIRNQPKQPKANRNDHQQEQP